jgi:sugar O-acyltransferase (sialic acid O-acetyltransferase NeuD family)
MNLKKSLVIIGAGGHAKVVLDALLLSGLSESIFIADDNVTILGKKFQDFDILCDVKKAIASGNKFHVAIGDNLIRSKLYESAKFEDAISIFHPQSIISRSAFFEGGVFVAAGVIIGPDVEIGRGAIVNHSSVIDHDCNVGRYCHIAPGSILGGGVEVGARTLIGMGAKLLPGVKIGADSIIAAGAVVLEDFPSNSIVAGIPAKLMAD